MTTATKDSETLKFIGCILSVKTKPCSKLGQIKNIIGTVRDIDIAEQAIILDDAISNGNILPDGYALLSSAIEDLTVIGTTKLKEVIKDDTRNNRSRVVISSSSSDGDEYYAGRKLNEPKNNNVLLNSLINIPPTTTTTTKHRIAKPKARKPQQQHSNMATTSSMVTLEVKEDQVKKLGVLSKFLDNSQQQQQQKINRPKQHVRNEETFEMSKSEMLTDFDFESSNAQFNKLPVVSLIPKLLCNKKTDPVFTSFDTTFESERVVSSITTRNKVTKQFLTDTGIIIPSIDLPTRSKILNLAHDLGLHHSRMIESMSRSVVQTILPLFGDSYRLSPERSETERPVIFFACGPHWQGAVATATARILATLGVKTVVYSPKEELTVCAVEEKLYKLTNETFTRNADDLPMVTYELVVMALDDHLSRDLKILPVKYFNNSKITNLIYIDPPLVESYRNNDCRVLIITPTLPLAYNYENNVKFFIVNLGIPKHIFDINHVNYVSPYGDKITLQVFNNK